METFLDRALKDLDSSLRKVGKVRMKAALEELGLNNTAELFEQLGLELARRSGELLFVARRRHALCSP